MNQYHGGDAAGCPAFSARVDGRFTDELRRTIPEAPTNPASRSALWACVTDGAVRRHGSGA